MAEEKLSPALQAIIDEYNANKGKGGAKPVQQGPVDNPLKDPTIKELLREGGFTDEERVAILALPQARAVSLGPRILRADTAMAAAVSLWMAAAGDWSRHGER